MSKQTNYCVNRNELAAAYETFKKELDSKSRGNVSSIYDAVAFIEKELKFWRERAEHYAQVADESFNIW